MNVFLPYEDDIVKSVQSLDDVRLNKQIEECKTMVNAILEHKNSGLKIGYFHHPVTQFYYNNPQFIAYYGLCCGIEYCERHNKTHFTYHSIVEYCETLLEKCGFLIYKQPQYQPYYMEGSIKDPNHIRTTENVSALFQQKLIKKWEADNAKGRQPKWTNREVPQFYQQWLKENGDD